MRHFGCWSFATDHFDQLIAIELRFVQVWGLARRTRIATSIALRAMAELAVRLVLIEPLTKGCVLEPATSNDSSNATIAAAAVVAAGRARGDMDWSAE
jgi:hypothetical protein